MINKWKQRGKIQVSNPQLLQKSPVKRHGQMIPFPSLYDFWVKGIRFVAQQFLVFSQFSIVRRRSCETGESNDG